MRNVIVSIVVSALLVSFGGPIRSSVAGRSIVSENDGQQSPEYISDGLFFYDENIAPPSSGLQRI